MIRNIVVAGVVLAGSLFCVECVCAQTPPAASQAPVAPSETDYSKPAVWLCLPGREDSCTVNQDATIVGVDGKLKHEAYHAAKAPAIDCFYVYPTVSNEPTGNSDLIINREEKSVVLQQFARFGSKCRLFAPMYRQVTLTGLRSMLSGTPMKADPDLGYSDVLAAWRYYLDHENKGRGFVLVGHSQGSSVLLRLIKEEIDGKPIQKQLLSAILMGTYLAVPKGADVGGAFQHIPLCHSKTQTGCAIAFADFRANVPPPSSSRLSAASGTRFGIVQGEGMQAACVNPAALGGGSGKLDAYLSARRVGAAGDAAASPASWTTPEQTIDTPFVKVPGLLTAECINNEHGSYIAVTVHPSDKGKRTNDITGDVIINGKVNEDWGLHLIDPNLHMGNLVAIVGDEAKAYDRKAN
jgi:hypothetical protein